MKHFKFYNSGRRSFIGRVLSQVWCYLFGHDYEEEIGGGWCQNCLLDGTAVFESDPEEDISILSYLSIKANGLPELPCPSCNMVNGLDYQLTLTDLISMGGIKIIKSTEGKDYIKILHHFKDCPINNKVQSCRHDW